MIWKKRIKRKTKIFYVDRHPSGIRNILDIHRYLMKENNGSIIENNVWVC